MKRFCKISACILLLSGMLFLLSPLVLNEIYQKKADAAITAFNDTYRTSSIKTPAFQRMQRQMELYNQTIYEEKQQELRDAWSYQQNEFDLQTIGLQQDMIGYLTIEAMDLKTPLYVGATSENIEEGAAVLFETSMPIGGKNTNCVIVAHRGGRYGPMFRDIEVLEKGDRIQVDNPWETLEYEVVKTIVIYPDEIDKIKIQEGKDMITLVTCHPYPDNYQRYVVYCQRVTADTNASETDIPYESVTYESSEQLLKWENILRGVGIISAGGILLLWGICSIYRHKKHRHE